MTGADGLIALIALIAMLPAAFNPSLAVEENSLISKLCSSGISVAIPLGSPELPGTIPSMCCTKGCHNKRSEKRRPGKIDLAQ